MDQGRGLRAKAWHNAFNRLQRCYERNEDVIDAFFDLAEAIITVRRLIREAWTLYRWAGRPAKRPSSPTYPRDLQGAGRWEPTREPPGRTACPGAGQK